MRCKLTAALVTSPLPIETSRLMVKREGATFGPSFRCTLHTGMRCRLATFIRAAHYKCWSKVKVGGSNPTINPRAFTTPSKNHKRRGAQVSWRGKLPPLGSGVPLSWKLETESSSLEKCDGDEPRSRHGSAHRKALLRGGAADHSHLLVA